MGGSQAFCEGRETVGAGKGPETYRNTLDEEKSLCKKKHQRFR